MRTSRFVTWALVMVISAFGLQAAFADHSSTPDTTFSGCLLKGTIRKVVTNTKNPERCLEVGKNNEHAKFVTWSATGSQGAEGPPGEASEGAQPDCRAVTQRWDLAACGVEAVEFDVGASASLGATFDGEHLWIVSPGAALLTKIDVDTGEASNILLPDEAVDPRDVLFDGQFLWTANFSSNNVSRITPGTEVVKTFDLPSGADGPNALAFDGTFVWVANTLSDNVTRLRVTGSGTNFSLPGASDPIDIVYTGEALWIANLTSSNVTRLTTTGSATTFALPGGSGSPVRLAFDGYEVWTVNTSSSNLSAFTPVGGAARNIELPDDMVHPIGLVFDGQDLWTLDADSVARTRDGIGSRSFDLSQYSDMNSLAFDGVNVWVVGNSKVLRLTR